jgi:hypothetical protein
MIPSSKWFPSSLQDRAAWYGNFYNNLAAGTPTLGSTLGLSAGDITTISDDNEAMTFCAASTTYLDSFIDAFRQYRKTVTEGEIGDPSPVVPTFIPLAASPAAPTGIYERLDNFVKRIRVAPAYTPEIGALLAIIPTKSEDLVETEMKPALKPASMPGSVVEVQFVRGKADGVQIETKTDGSAGWNSEGKFLKSPITLNIPDGNGMPHSVQLRARYFIGNDMVGLYSEIYTVVTTP